MIPSPLSPLTMSHRIYSMSFAKLYPCYTEKAERKGRTPAEVNQIIEWLTGYTSEDLQALIEQGVTVEEFFMQAPRMNPNRALITGVICGVRIEEIEETTMREIRYLDKLIDELARGKSLEKILRKN